MNQSDSTRSFHKTTVTVTVLSEDGPPEFDDLAELHRLGDSGPCVVDYEVESVAVTAPEMARLLNESHSTPEFFNLDDKGNDLDEDEDADAET